MMNSKIENRTSQIKTAVAIIHFKTSLVNLGMNLKNSMTNRVTLLSLPLRWNNSSTKKLKKLKSLQSLKDIQTRKNGHT